MFGRLLVVLFVAVVATHDSARAQAPVATPNAERANAGTIGVISEAPTAPTSESPRTSRTCSMGMRSAYCRSSAAVRFKTCRTSCFSAVSISASCRWTPGGLTPTYLQNSAQRLRYLARLYNEELHVLASRDIASVRDLEERKSMSTRPAAAQA